MNKRLPLAALSAIVFVAALACLTSGAGWLAAPLLTAWPLPTGNLIAAVMYISLAALTVIATRPATLARGFALVLMAAAVLWLPVSIWLAGNLNLNFAGGWQGELWTFYTYKALPAGCLLLILWHLIGRRYLLRGWAAVERSPGAGENR